MISRRKFTAWLLAVPVVAPFVARLAPVVEPKIPEFEDLLLRVQDVSKFRGMTIGMSVTGYDEFGCLRRENLVQTSSGNWEGQIRFREILGYEETVS